MLFIEFVDQGFLTLICLQVEWRCRAKLAVRGTSEDPQIGIFEEGTHSIVDIPLCRSTLLLCAILYFRSTPCLVKYHLRRSPIV